MLSITLALICLNPIHAQRKKVIFVNSKKIDTNRYAQVQGSPYFYKDWKYGKVVTFKTSIIDSVMLNYNAYTQSIEARQDNEFVELDPEFYPLVVFYEPDSTLTYFRRNHSRHLGRTYSRIVYRGDHATVLQHLVLRIDVKISNYGGLPDIERFAGSKKYYLILNEETVQIKLTKKSILSHLGYESEIKDFVKSEKLSLKTEEDLAIVLDFYSTLVEADKRQ